MGDGLIVQLERFFFSPKWAKIWRKIRILTETEA